MNKYELQLIKDIRIADECVMDAELEIDHWDPEDGKSGWYAYKYIEGYGSVPLLDDDEPLITDETIEKHNVDVYKVFDYCDVAYCG